VQLQGTDHPAGVTFLLFSFQLTGKMEAKTYTFAAPMTESNTDLKTAAGPEFGAVFLDSDPSSTAGSASIVVSSLNGVDQFGDVAYSPHGTAQVALVDGTNSPSAGAPGLVTLNITY
jgi:hypothetical protein